MEHCQVGRVSCLRIEQVALTVGSNLCPIVRALYKQGKHLGLQLTTYVYKRVSEWTSDILRAFTQKFGSPAAIICFSLAEHIKIIFL